MNMQYKIHPVFWAWILMVMTPFSAYGVDGQIKITQPSTYPIIIDQPGSYVVTRTINVSTTDANGIEIHTDNVTLDLNGHTLIGPGKENGSSGSGIFANNKNNIVIINGTLRDFKECGILLNGSNNLIRNLNVYSNGLHGISANSSTRISNCAASYNGSHGFHSLGSAITGCVAFHNGFHGISASSSSSISDCTSNHNGSHGFYVTNSTVVNCTAYQNSGRGVSASASSITNCTANQNQSHGIYVSSECRMAGNNLRGNGGYGLYLSSSYNYAIKNTASTNTSGNFYAVSNNHIPLSGDDANYGW